MSQERARDSLADERLQESRYHLGRVLYESKRDLGRAVNELEKGAPLGHEDEVREFLGSRAKAPEVLC